MYQVIDNPYLHYPNATPANYEYMKRSVDTTVNQLKSYYFFSDFVVENSNIFVRIIEYLYKDNESIYEAMDRIDSLMSIITNKFEIISPFTRGEIKETVTLISTSHYIDPLSLTDWKDIVAVKYIMSDDADLALIHPKDKPNEKAIVTIDLKAMLMQFILWKRDMVAMDIYPNPRKFVANVLLTTLMPTLLPILFYKYTYMELPIKSIKRHPVSVKPIDDIVRQYIYRLRYNILRKRRANLTFYIQNMRTNDTDLSTFLSRNYGALNRQNIWLVWYLETYYLRHIIESIDYNPGLNRSILTTAKYILWTVAGGNYLNNTNLGYLDYDMRDTMKWLKELYRR